MINKWIGLKWLVLPITVKGLPIFNFEITLTKINMHVDTDNNWSMVYEFEEQGVL